MNDEILVHDPGRKLKALKTLRKLPFFHGLYDDEYEKLFSICQSCSFLPNQGIFTEGDASLFLYVVLNGKVEISTKKKGVIYIVKPGEIFGEIGLISQKRRTASAKTLDSAALLQIKRDDFNMLLGTQPRISAILLRNITLGLSGHIVRMNDLGSTEYLPMHFESGSSSIPSPKVKIRKS
jgi:CRP-like cAMP-binding protein